MNDEELSDEQFQLTAARRRLALDTPKCVSVIIGFNSQPPEGSWTYKVPSLNLRISFQLTAARRRLVYRVTNFRRLLQFQLTAARRRLGYEHRTPRHYRWFQLTAARRRLGRK